MNDAETDAPESPGDRSAAGAKAPRLSLAVAAPRVRACDIQRFLASRAAAGVRSEDEVLIAASPAPGTSTDLEELERKLANGEEPGVSLSLHPDSTTPMQLWGFAMARARGGHIAVLDGRDSLGRGWVSAWADAVERGEGPILCGPVDPGNFENSCSWAAYLSEYGRFWTPLSPDDLDEAPGNNIVFPRSALPDSEVLRREGFWKTFHLEALKRESESGSSSGLNSDLGSANDSGNSTGAGISVSAGMRVEMQRRYQLAGYLRRRYLHGRCYGGRRLEQPDSPSRLLCIGFTPLLPALRTARVLRRLIPQNSRVWPWGALGPLVLGEIAWSWGELSGYARGAGTACEELW